MPGLRQRIGVHRELMLLQGDGKEDVCLPEIRTCMRTFSEEIVFSFPPRKVSGIFYTHKIMPISEVYNMDCMDYMRSMPDKFFELAVVDPPYFDGPNKLGYYGKDISSFGIKRPGYQVKHWKIPEKSYFTELLRVSKNQIIWGCNYFLEFTALSPGRIVWNKANGNSSFSDC